MLAVPVASSSCWKLLESTSNHKVVVLQEGLNRQCSVQGYEQEKDR